MPNRFLFMLMFILCFGSNLPAQDTLQHQEEKTIGENSGTPSPLKFDQNKIAELKKDPAFDYSEAALEENWWTTFKRYIGLQWQRLLNWLFGDIESSPTLALFLEVLPYLLIFLFLLFLIYLFAKLAPSGGFLDQKQKPRLILDEDEKIIRTEDIPELIKKAISEGDYRLAIRYHFLFILQQLTQRNLVQYDSSKTDEEYLAELNDNGIRAQFQKINRIYDFIWYGNFEADPDNYEKIRKDFQKMELLINQK